MGKRILSLEAVSSGGLGGELGVRNSAIKQRLGTALGERLGLRRGASPTLNLPSEELLTQGQGTHSRKPDSLSAKLEC